ncbi:hypothetical protein [Dysgonomonas reticulitermitis]
MNVNRYILIILLILPVLAVAQKIGEKRYRVTTGDTTKIVSRLNTGLTGPEFEFLFSAKGKVVDSLYNEIQPNLTSLQAVREVNDILKEIERDQAILKAGNTSLSYRLSTEYITANKKEKSARAYADSLLLEQKRMSENELISKYLTYGDKPSYFVNGTPVNPEIANFLLPGDVISRDLKTNTPNPNGEIWLVLTEKAVNRLKLPAGDMYDSDYNTPAYNLKNTDNSKKDQNKAKPSQPVIKNNSQEIPPQPKVDTAPAQSQGERRTIVRSRSINNEPVEVKNN